MIFNRAIYKDLEHWKIKSDRKPLLLMGARQIGKTTLLKEFGEKEYEHLVYLNLERQTDAHDFFKGNKDPEIILNSLSLMHGKEIEAKNTLIVLDEIQECRDALIALKYFQEEIPEIHIIGAGSLLGLSMGNDRSFPVGKVEFMDMYPLNFSEYLEQADQKAHKAYQHYLENSSIVSLPAAFFNPLKEKFKEFILIGGMPEVASKFLENKNIGEAQKVQEQILRAYELDFVKHADKTTSTKIQQVWNSLPSQLARENKKFVYKLVRSGARAREYEEAIQWLTQAGLIYKIPQLEKIGTPLKAYENINAYKLYAFETGLLMRIAELDPKVFINGDQFFTEFKGSIAENFVAQSLKKTYGSSPYYWTSKGKAEIDFVIEESQNIIPVEVKSGYQTKAKSLAVYKDLFNPALRIRISNLNLKLTDDLLNIPLFYSEFTDKLINKVLKR